MAYNYDVLIKPEYRDMCLSIFKQTQDTYFGRLSDLIDCGLLRDDAVTLLNDALKRESGAEIISEELLQGIDIYDKIVLSAPNDKTLLLTYVSDWIDKAATQKLLLQHAVDRVMLVLPHQQPKYKRNQRYLIDKILTDGQRLKCTDVHIEPVANFNGGFEYVIKYRRGLFLQEVTSSYNLSTVLIDDMIHDMIANRSRSSFKAAKALTDTEVKFTLIDPLFPTRCEVVKTIGGSMLVIRFFDFKDPFRITTLGFPKETERDLYLTGEITSGLSLVSGVIGSGKGTTINAIALEIQEKNKYSIISIDSPTEYLGRFPQIEYQSEHHLYEAANAVKKLDRNFVLLNEIATRETAMAVYNLVVSGVHVLTTIHNNRVYRVMYKLNEMLGDLYLNLIPFINLLSYQDKFSKTCSCRQRVSIDHYSDDRNKVALLEFLGLDIIEQPMGCSLCNNTGYSSEGIQVVSEHLMFTSSLKDELQKVNIHEQTLILRDAVRNSVNLESVLADKLRNGEVLIGEVMTKLDSWR